MQASAEAEEREYTSRLNNRISDLETQLSHEKCENKRLREENSDLRHKIATGDGVEQVERLKRKVEELMGDNSELQMKIRRLQDEKTFSHYGTLRTSSSINDLYGIKENPKSHHFDIENRRLQVGI